MNIITNLLHVHKRRGLAEDEIRRISTLYYFLLLASIIFFIGGIIDLIIDLKAVPFEFFVLYVSLMCLIIIALRLGVNYQLVVHINIFINYLIVEFAFYLNPNAYHVFVYWACILPLLAVITVETKAARFWTALIFATIVANGVYVHSFITATYLIYPSKFAVGGILFGLTVYFLSNYFHKIQKEAREELKKKNDELIELKNEVEAQNNQLLQQRDELASQKEYMQTQNKNLEKFWKTLLKISQSPHINQGNVQEVVEMICREASNVLNISRVSIWKYNHEADELSRLHLFQKEGITPDSSVLIPAISFPAYFKQIKSKRIIIADNARTNPATIELSALYFEPLQIYSLLDASFIIDGELGGVICCENQYDIIQWHASDILLVNSLADILSLVYKAAQNITFINQIRIQNQELLQNNYEIAHFNEELSAVNELLEVKVKERTEALEIQNQQLAEYAFINSHLLRAPLSRILGLVNLLVHCDLSNKEKDLVAHLGTSGNELDDIIKKINTILEEGGQLDRKVLRQNT